MAHFRGTLQGDRGPASRLGSRKNGLKVKAASWQGAVETTLYEKDGVDYYRVALVPHHGAGRHKVLAEGRCDGVVLESEDPTEVTV